MLSNILDRISFWSIFTVIVMLPLFFLPFTNIPLDISKSLLLVVGLVVSIISWSAARFSDGKIILPKSKLLLSLLGFVLIVLLSAIFSPSLNTSLFGVMLDFGSFWFMLCAFLLMFMSSIVISSDKKAKYLMKGFLMSSVVVILFQIARFFIPETLALGFFSSSTGNLVGAWNSLGLFGGLTALVVIFIFEFLKLNKQRKILLAFILLISLFLIASVNFLLVWKLVGIFALIMFVYKIALTSSAGSEGGHRKQFPFISFSVILLSLMFFVSGQFIGGLLPNVLKLNSIEINPSFTTTFNVTKEVFKQNPLLGVGPNKFNQAWDLYKPDVINQSQFWNTPFVSGYSTITTLIVTTGILGLLSLIVFISCLLWSGTKNVFQILKDKKHHEILLYFIIVLYLVLAAILYSPGVTLFLLLFAFIGVFIGVSSVNLESTISFSFLDDPRKSFFSILFLVVLMIFTAGISFKYIEKIASVSYFAKTLSASSIDDAEIAITRALLLNNNDLYLRTATQVYLSKLSSLISSEKQLTDEEKIILQNSIDLAINRAIASTLYNPKNYLNFEILGFVYKNVASLGVEGASQQSIEAYTQASNLNPKNPLIKLELARVYIIDKKIQEGKIFALEALTLKPDFLQALIFLAQLEKEEGNNTKAIEYAERALFIAPTNSDLIEYVKFLKTGSRNTNPVVLEEDSINLEQ
jgi:tetratricopeptide (TPR) repeat protein